MSVLGNLLFTVLFFSQFLNFFPGLLFIYLFLSKIWNKQSYEMAFRAGSAVKCSTASPALGRCCLSATVPAFVLVLVCFQLCDVELWECLSVLLGKT